MPATASSQETKSTSRTTTAYGKKLPVASLSSAQYQAGGKIAVPYNEEELLAIQAQISALYKDLSDLKKEKKTLEASLKDSDTLQDEEIKTQKKLEDIERQIENTEREIDPLLVKRVEQVSETVKHHAEMRVDLFFLLCIALYNKNVDVIKGKTILQHGKGSKEFGTAACHASLFPNIYTRNSTPKSSSSWSFFSALEDEDESTWLPYYLASISQKKSTSEETLLAEFGEDSILHGTHFDDSLNLTHELPHIVNSFDCILEGTYQRSNEIKLLLEVLNKVSHGKLTPDQALHRFLEIMHNFFTGMNNQFSSMGVKTKESIPFPRAMSYVKELQKEGTFRHTNSPSTIRAYIDCMTQLQHHTQHRIEEGFWSTLSLLYKGPLGARYQALQEEIFKTSSSLLQP